MIRSQVLICGGTGCTSSGSQQIQDAFEVEIEKNNLQDEIKLVRTGCFGLCELGPVVIVYPDGTFYSRVEVNDVEEIVTEHLLKGRRVERLVYDDHGKAKADEYGNIALSDTTFYKTQNRVVLRNCGVINPEDIDEYIAMDGYAA
ncbi:MAG: NAD(P)H-dependent oxidoreductase subunit E, partial [Coriobacteriales bacterium]|nr:NAD(P)H-dependent oxidoreductase subunit E [Coriobacteriales bacterium]